MNSTKQLLLISSVLLILSSCSLYTPGFINAPKYDGGDINIGANVGTTADFNVSASPVSHLSILANATYALPVTYDDDPISSNENNSYDYPRYQIEGAVGYYYEIGNGKAQHDFHVGYGFGKGASFLNNFVSGEDGFAANISNVFFQSSFIFQLEDDLDILFTSKYNMVKYDDFEFSATEGSQLNSDFEALQNLKEWDHNVIQFGMGFVSSLEFMDIVLQGQFSFTDRNGAGTFNVRPIGATMGFNIKIDKLIKAE